MCIKHFCVDIPKSAPLEPAGKPWCPVVSDAARRHRIDGVRDVIRDQILRRGGARKVKSVFAHRRNPEPACSIIQSRPRSRCAHSPALLFGLRLWASVCLALYIAFWLQLDNPYWAGASAAAVCQPSLGASLRKAWFRMIGTAVGAVAIVVLTACFPQNRIGFLLGLALWGAACGLVATLLHNFAGYAAALAGITAAIIASDEVGAIGGANGDVLHTGGHPRKRNLHRHHLRGRRTRCDRFWRRAAPAGRSARSDSSEIAGGLAGTFLLAGQSSPETRWSGATLSDVSPRSIP